MLSEAPKTGNTSRTGNTAPRPSPSEAELPPKFLEYRAPTDGQVWQVEKFDLLAVEFGASWRDGAPGVPGGAPDTAREARALPTAREARALPEGWAQWMATLHAFAEPDTQRWYYLRRLFGIVPLIPPDGTTTEDLRCLAREELAVLTGITPAQLAEEIAHLKQGWQKANEVRSAECGVRNSATAAAGTESELRPNSELPLGDELLRRFDFDKSNFEVEIYAYDDVTKSNVYRPRPAEKTRKELEWFIGRLMRPEWQQMLEDPTDGSLARSALMNELYLHRFDAEMMMLMPNTPKWKTMAGDRQKIEEQFQSQLSQLKNDFPELGVAGRVTSHAIVSDMNLAHRQYYGHNENKLWDGVHTAAEIVFLNRTSAQLPVPRYRLSWQIMVAEARHGLYDPNFRSMLKKGDLKKLDRGYQRGVEEARLEDGEKQVDLERGVIPGEPGCDEFPDYLADRAGTGQPDKRVEEGAP